MIFVIMICNEMSDLWLINLIKFEIYYIISGLYKSLSSIRYNIISKTRIITTGIKKIKFTTLKEIKPKETKSQL